MTSLEAPAAPAMPDDEGAESEPARRRRRSELTMVLGRAFRFRKTQFGVVLVAIVVLIAVIGPFVASPNPLAIAGPPFADPSHSYLLGTDVLGRSVLSRWLAGGWVILLCAVLATALGVGLGVVLGVLAAWKGGKRDEAIMRSLDVILSFPAIILALLLLSVIGPHLWLVVLAVAFAHAPGSARVVRSVALDVRRREFVQVSEALGVSDWRIMFGEIVPNITSQILVEFGLRLTWSIGLISALAFLGLGRQPPAPDWGLMINENRVGMSFQPWGVAAPIISIALVTVGVNFITDGISRSAIGIGRSADRG